VIWEAATDAPGESSSLRWMKPADLTLSNRATCPRYDSGQQVRRYLAWVADVRCNFIKVSSIPTVRTG
jgi:hypothetical protein